MNECWQVADEHENHFGSMSSAELAIRWIIIEKTSLIEPFALKEPLWEELFRVATLQWREWISQRICKIQNIFYFDGNPFWIAVWIIVCECDLNEFPMSSNGFLEENRFQTLSGLPVSKVFDSEFSPYSRIRHKFKSIQSNQLLIWILLSWLVLISSDRDAWSLKIANSNQEYRLILCN